MKRGEYICYYREKGGNKGIYMTRCYQKDKWVYSMIVSNAIIKKICKKDLFLSLDNK